MKQRKILTSLVSPAMLVSLILVAAACGEVAKPAAAPVPSGTIEGIVEYADVGPVLGMRLTVVDGTAPFPEISPATNEDGVYRFTAIPPGTFSVAVHDAQGNRVALESVEVKSGEASILNFILRTPP